MKKTFFISLILVALATSVFASDYVVASVKGKVQYEASPNVWKDVTVGQKLSDSTNLNTSLNSTVVLTVDGKEVTIKAMQKGSVDSLVASNSGAKGIKKGAAIKSSSVAAKSDGTSKGVSTASSRASEAKEDMEWAE